MSLKTARARRLRELANRLGLQLQQEMLSAYARVLRRQMELLDQLNHLKRREWCWGPWVLRLYHDPARLLKNQPFMVTLAGVEAEETVLEGLLSAPNPRTLKMMVHERKS